LAKSIFKEKFDEELMDESNKREILRHTIGNVLKEHQVEPLRIVLFGSRARDDFDKDSDWDVLVVIKERLTRKEKEKISEMIRKRLARFLIPCDIIVKYADELTLYENFYGTATYEALKEGIPL
jgi:predicted nucleotidyltransferase